MLSIGRIVHYLLPEHFGPGAWRPAMIVSVHGEEDHLANLTVFLDGLSDTADQESREALCGAGQLRGNFLSVGSAAEGAAPGEWRWPPRVAAPTLLSPTEEELRKTVVPECFTDKDPEAPPAEDDYSRAAAVVAGVVEAAEDSPEQE